MLISVLSVFDIFIIFRAFVADKVVILYPLLPWCNRNGWLGVKHQVTYLLPSIVNMNLKDLDFSFCLFEVPVSVL